MQVFNRTKTILTQITSQSGNQIITLFDSGVYQDYLSVNAFVKNLKAFSVIKSIPDAKLPNLSIEDSESEKLYKTLNVEFNSPRKQLDILIKNPDVSDWVKIGSISLLNPSGYPYRMYNLLDFFTDGLAYELGENSQIGVQVKDVGYGLLGDGDLITIHGSALTEFISGDTSSQASTITTNNNLYSGLIFNSQKFTYNLDNSTENHPARLTRKYFMVETSADIIVTLLSDPITEINLRANGTLSLPNYIGGISITCVELATVHLYDFW